MSNALTSVGERGVTSSLWIWGLHGVADVAGHERVEHGLPQCLLKRRVDVLDGAGGEFVVELLAVEGADVVRREPA